MYTKRHKTHIVGYVNLINVQEKTYVTEGTLGIFTVLYFTIARVDNEPILQIPQMLRGTNQVAQDMF